MDIRIKKQPRAEFETVSVDAPVSIEQIVKTYGDKDAYTVIAAKRNHTLVSLCTEIDASCDIEFLDMRNQAANLIYQNSLILIYLKACSEILGNVNVDVRNSLSKGLFTCTEAQISQEQVDKIEARMKELINADLPFVLEEVSADKAKEIFISQGEDEKVALVGKHVDTVRFYSLDGYAGFFYGLMVPSTGYIEHFELKKYRSGVIVRFPHSSKPDQIPEYVEEFNLYDAFSEETEWNNIMGVSFVSDLNRKIENGEIRELIQLSEALHEKKVAQIADQIKKSGKRIILIAGPSSSGKTTFAKRLCIQLRVNGLNPLYMGTDDYFINRDELPFDENGEQNFEDLDAVDVPLFCEQMNALLEGKEADIPEYDFLSGKKIFGKRITKISSDRPIVIEGIHALNDAMTPSIPAEQKFKIYISPFTQLNIDRHNRIPTTDARMLRRMSRDYSHRGYSAQNTIKNWPKVRAGEDKNIFPYSNCADAVFNSVHIYELAVLKKYVWPLLWQIKPEEPEYCEAVRLIKFLSYFKTVEDDSVIVNNSILREFIGGSVLVH